MSFKTRAKKLKTNIPALFLSVKDKKTPVLAKVLAGITVAYALSPIDLVPDFIPALGFTDDLAALVWALKTISSKLPKWTDSKKNVNY